MIEISMVIGPKGQVVIPQALRRALKIKPGSRVLFKLRSNEVVIEPVIEDVVPVFLKTARSIRKGRTRLKPHDAYEEELKERLG